MGNVPQSLLSALQTLLISASQQPYKVGTTVSSTFADEKIGTERYGNLPEILKLGNVDPGFKALSREGRMPWLRRQTCPRETPGAGLS